MQVTDLIQAIAGLGVLATAFFTYRVAATTKKAVQAQTEGVRARTISDLIDAYAAPEMKATLEHIADAYRKESDFHLKFKNRRFAERGWKILDENRRRIHWYFKKCHRLWAEGLLSDEFMRDFIADTNGYSVFHAVVAPMSKDIDPSGDARRFAWIEDLRTRFPPRPFE